VAPQGYVAADYSGDDRGLPDVDVATASAERVWLVTGYEGEDEQRLEWFYSNYRVLSDRSFMGVDVTLGERLDDTAPAP
jgi:hypothetical protein